MNKRTLNRITEAQNSLKKLNEALQETSSHVLNTLPASATPEHMELSFERMENLLINMQVQLIAKAEEMKQ